MRHSKGYRRIAAGSTDRFQDVKTSNRKWLIGALAILLLIPIAAFVWLTVRFKPMLRERLVAAVREQYHRDVEFKDLSISVFPFSAVGEGFVLHQKDRPGLPPLATIKKLTVEAGLRDVLGEPLRIQRVRLDGLQLNIPPKRDSADKEHEPKRELPRFIIGEVIADGALLQVLPKKPGKEPLSFEISKLTLQSAGTLEPMKFRAQLKNAKPPGDIDSSGTFGPWQNDEPSLTPVAGDYTFRNANLSIFTGIAGTLASEGKYQGELGKIVVDGWTDTPDFTIKISGQPIHLKTQFHAIVDGTDGDTYLEPLKAQFGRSALVARGGVYGKPGVKGKTVSLDVTVSNSRIEDLLRLAAKGQPLMTGAVEFKTRFELPPGERDIAEKLNLNGGFEIASAHFTSFNVQGKVEELSQRARGQIGDQEGDTQVVSNMRGQFVMSNGKINFSSLGFIVPGATVDLTGRYTLGNGELDFAGTLRTDAKVSQMTTGIKSLLLKLADPFFRKDGAGAVIPIKVSGTRDEPKFGLDPGRVIFGK
jgi:hypothetical protein